MFKNTLLRNNESTTKNVLMLADKDLPFVINFAISTSCWLDLESGSAKRHFADVGKPDEKVYNSG